jgi:hypothetical protein
MLLMLRIGPAVIGFDSVDSAKVAFLAEPVE